MKFSALLGSFLVLGFGLWRAAGQGQGQAFSFTTPAGVAGLPGSSDGTNNAARFNEPSGVAIDSAGTIYVADTGNHVIRRITHSGNTWVTRTIAGLAGHSGSANGTNLIARFYLPFGIAVDAGGILYMADTYNHTIRKIVPSGTNWVVTTLAGSAGVNGSNDGSGDSANFYFPSGISVDSAGLIYVADSYNHTIRQVTPGGDVQTIAGTAGVSGLVNGTNLSAQFSFPSGLAVDPSGTIFVADTANDLIRQLTPSGPDWIVTAIAGLPRFPGSNDGTNRAAQFYYPFGMASGGAGKLFVADTLNDSIRAMNLVGTNWVVTTPGGLAGSSGSTDGAGSAARFFNPYGVASDPSGDLVVLDSYNHTIRYGQTGFLLQIARATTLNQVVLSWPVAASNFVLETSSSLARTAVWNALSGATLSGNTFYRTNSVGPGPSFFRLYYP